MSQQSLLQRIGAAWRVLRGGWGSSSPESIAYGSRVSVWSINQAMYDGTVYEIDSCRRKILETYCGVKDGRGRIIGHYNPARGIVDAQQNVLRGTWGKDIKPVLPQDGNSDKEKPVSPALAESLKTIWRDSNLDTAKTRTIQLAAMFGTVGMRVSRIPGTDRVVIQTDDSSRLFNVEEDSSGNVISVVLKYKIPHNFGTPIEPDIQQVEVVELISKDEFSRKVEGTEKIASDDRKNTFGFCPYVLLRHKENGTIYGDWAFRGLEPQIHDINWRITQQGRSINRTQFAQWFLSAGGLVPKEIDQDGETKMWYVQAMTGTPPPIAQALVPDIDQASALLFTESLETKLLKLAPVLALTDQQLLSGLSGESIAQILIPAAGAIADVRPLYHHAFIRALQMAASLRIDMGLTTDLGTSGDAAYKSGALAFSFNDQPALPPTVSQQIQGVTLEQLKSGKIAPNATTIGGGATVAPKAGQPQQNATNTNGARLADRLKQRQAVTA